MYAIGPNAIVVAASSGTRIAGAVVTHPGLYGPPTYVIPTPVTASIRVSAELDEAAFKLPLFYDLLGECTVGQDTELVQRDDVPLYAWDSIPVWDTDPFSWDEVIGPETILRSTMRIVQLDMEKTCLEISEIARLYDLKRASKDILPYHAALLGTPLPGVSPDKQRAFLEQLVSTYQRKGTPLSFLKLFEQIGFDLTLEETYQRKGDAAFIDGPQMALKSNPLIVDEPLGTTELGKVTYRMQTMNPIVRGTLRLEFFDQSDVFPTEIIDDGAGGWGNDFAGFVNYESGVMEITLKVTPALAGQAIQATYDHRIDAFPHTTKEKYTDRTRSSLVQFAITPNDPSVSLTEESIDRIELYLRLLKPAHVLIRNLDLILNLEDTEVASDVLQPYTLQFVESLFGTQYAGMGWAAEDNGSRDPDSASFPQTQHRIGNEFLKDPMSSDPDSLAPYVYPFIANGLFTQNPLVGETFTNTGFGISGFVGDKAVLDSSTTNLVTNLDENEYIDLDGFADEDLNGIWQVTGAPAGAGPWTAEVTRQDPNATIANEAAGATVALTRRANTREADWFDLAAANIFGSTVTADSGQTTTTFSIDKLSGTGLGEGDHLAFHDGPAGGESRPITSITDNGTYYDMVVASAYSVAPEVGDVLTILDEKTTVNARNLEAGYRQQERADLYFGHASTVAPDGILTSFTINSTKTPLLGGSVSFLRFTIGTVEYEETAEATGGFTNTSGEVSSSNINYTTGVATVTFATAPDNLSTVQTLNVIAGTANIGDY